MAQYSGQTNTSITTTLARSGKVASRVAEPATIRAEHESSKVADHCGDPGQQQRHHVIVAEQHDRGVSARDFRQPGAPEHRRDGNRNISWTVGSGKGSSKAVA
jgi:hypothetical protein